MQRFLRNTGTVFLTFAMVVNSAMPVMALSNELSADTEAVNVQVYDKENGINTNDESGVNQNTDADTPSEAKDEEAVENEAAADSGLDTNGKSDTEEETENTAGLGDSGAEIVSPSKEEANDGESSDTSDGLKKIDQQQEENQSQIDNNIDQATSLLKEAAFEEVLTPALPDVMEVSEDFKIESGVLIEYTGTETEVVIPEGVTVIGSGGMKAIFPSSSKVTSVTIADSVTEIADSAFYACTELADIQFSTKGNLKKIGKSAFMNTKAASLEIPEGVTEIGDSALYGSALRSVSLPESLEILGKTSVYNAFSATSGTAPLSPVAIAIAEGNANYSIKNEAVYDKEGKALLYCPSAKTGSYEIAEGTKTIASYAFKSAALSQVVIPDSVEEIAANAFSGAKLTGISIPGSVKNIGESAFYNSKVKTVVLAEGVERIGKNAFGECYFNNLILPKSLIEVGGTAFDCFSGEIRILNPETVLGKDFVSYYEVITVYGLENSTAQAYVSQVAAEKGDRCKLKFEVLQEAPEIAVESVAMNKKEVTISVGDKVILSAEVLPAEAADRSLTWSVLTEGIITVDQAGTVQAVAPGKATVKATSSNNISDTCEVTVTAASDFVIESGVLISYTGSEESIVIPEGVLVIGNGTDAILGKDSKVSAVTLPASATKIADKAFYYTSTLKEIHFSSQKNLKEIGASAFQLATKLEEIAIPEGVTKVGTQAFVGTYSLKSVTLPSTLQEFGEVNGRFDSAFIYAVSKGHDTLTQINVAEGNSVYSSKDGVVYSADGKTLLFVPHAKTGTLTVADGTEQIASYAMAKGSLQKVILPNSLSKINDSAFYETKLMEITVPGSVKSIGKLAFFNSQMRSVKLEEGLERIEDNAFSQSRVAGVIIPESVKEIGKNAFDFEYGSKYWIQIKGSTTEFADEFIPYYYTISVYAPNGSSAEQYIIDKKAAKGASCKLAFYELGSFTDVTTITISQNAATLKRTETLKLSVTIDPEQSQATITGWSSSNPAVASVDQNGLVTAVQPGTAEITAMVSGHTAACSITVAKEDGESDFTIDENGFITGFIGLDITNLVIPETVNGKEVHGIAAGAFSGKSGIKTLVIGGHVKTIGKEAFRQCTGLTALTLGEGIKTIGEAAFNGCEKLQSVEIPEGIETLSANVFTSCAMLQEITLPSTLKSIGEAAFRSCTKLTEITLPEGLISIGKYAFLGCPLTTLHLPASLEKMGEEYIGEVFEVPGTNPANTAMKTITVAAGNVKFSAYDGLLYDKAATKVMFCPRGRTEAVIREGVTRINDYAFFMCFDLVSVKMPSTLKEVGSQAFHYCEALTDCTLPEGLLIVEESAFFGCEKWEEFEIPASVQRIDAYGFAECAAKEIKVPEGVKRIENFAFWGYEDTLEKITLPSTLEYIGDSAFAWAKKVKEIVIPEGVTEIGAQAFGRWDSLERISLPSSLKKIGKEAFIAAPDGSALKEIFISSNVTSIGEQAFKNYGDKLTIVTDQYGDSAALYAVKNGHLLRIEGASENDFVIENGVLVRYEGTASEIVIPNTVKEIGEGVFAEEEESKIGLKKIVIPSSVIKIGKNAFHGSGVTEVVFSDGSQLKTIGESTFAYCTKLAAITLPETVTEIGASAFDGASLLGEITIPSSVVTIGERAFNVCTGLRKVTFATPSSLKTIGAKAFYNCFRLTELNIPEGVEEVGDEAFRISKTFERITLPSTLTKLGSSVPAVFSAVENATQTGSDSLLEVNIAAGNPVYTSWEGSVYSADGKTLLFVPSAKSGTIAVKAGTETVGKNTLMRSKLDHIVLPDTLKSISENAFTNSSISSAEIPASVKSIGNSAFFWCNNLKSITLKEGLETISYGAFSESPLSNVTLPSSVRSVGKYAFDSVQSWVAVKGSDTVLEKDWISYYKDLTVYGPEKSTAADYVTATKSEYKDSCKLKFASLTTFVPVTKVELNQTAVSLKRFETFKLEVTVLPENATHKDVTFKSLNSKVATVDNNGKITAVSAGSAEIQVLSSDGPLVSCIVTVEKSEEDSDYTINSNGEITGYYGIDKDLVFPSEIGGVAVTGIADYAFSKNHRITSITLPESLQSIGDGAFENCINLGSITFSTGLKKIGKEAFNNCGYLSEVSLPEGLMSMGEGAFMNCEKLESVTFPSTLREIPKNAFMTCWRLLNVTLPEGVEVIGEDAFYECEGMETLSLPNSLRTIKEGAFTACVSLQKVVIPEGVTTIEKEAFMSCTDLKSIHLPSTLTKLGSKYAGDVFEQGASVLGCDHLETITVAEGNAVFSSSDNLLYSKDGKTLLFCPRGRTSAEVQEGTVTIGDSAFFFCLKLESVSIPESVKNLDANAFHLCENLKKINLPKGLETIGYGALAECVSLTELTIPASVTSIGTFALSGLNLSSIELPSSVTTLGDKVFSSSMHLKKVLIPSTVKKIGTNLFLGCDSELYIITDSQNSEIYRYAVANNVAVQVTGGSGGGGKGGSSTPKPNPAEETKTTKSTDEKTGAITEKKEYADGTTEKIVTEKNGTITKTTTKPNGAISNTETRLDGTQIDTEISSGGTVTAKIQLSAATGQEKKVQVTIPTAKNPDSGLVAILINADGSREIIKTSIPSSEGISFAVDASAEIELIDNSKKFTDVSSSDWHADAVNFVAARELFAGTGNEKFEPNAAASRAMIFTALARFEGQEISGGATWYSKASEWAVSQGISDGSNPNSEISREQLVSMLYRYAGAPKTESDLSSFSDADALSAWSVDAMRWAVENHIISGKGDNTLAPSAHATRAEIAAMMQRFIAN